MNRLPPVYTDAFALLIGFALLVHFLGRYSVANFTGTCDDHRLTLDRPTTKWAQVKGWLRSSLFSLRACAACEATEVAWQDVDHEVRFLRRELKAAYAIVAERDAEIADRDATIEAINQRNAYLQGMLNADVEILSIEEAA